MFRLISIHLLLQSNVCNDLAFFCGRRPLPFGGSHFEWTSRDSNHHQQSVSAGKTNAIPTEPSGRLVCNDLAEAMKALDGKNRGPCLDSFFEVCCIKVAEAQRCGFNEAFWLMAAGRATVPTLYACCLTKRFFSVQRLHGFRQVVTHVQPQQKR